MIMKKNRFILIGIVICFIFTIIYIVYSSSVRFDKYEGESLKIGIWGSIPKIKENQIEFVSIDLDQKDIETQIIEYDAVFITEDNLKKAASNEYLDLYKNTGKPFFFIKSTKSYIPFIIEELDYDAVDWEDNSYITGILVEDEEFNYWGYGLYNDTENTRNVETVYSMVFKTIEECKNEFYEKNY